MNEQRIQQLKEVLREAVQALISRGTPLSDQEKVMLTQMMEHVATRIQQLRQEDQAQQQEQPPLEEEPVTPTPVPAPAEVPPLEPAPFESSNINAFQYEPRSKELYVKFQDKYPAQDGPIYKYSGVPSFIFEVFSRGAIGPKTSGRNRWHTWKKGITPSHGAAMAALIKAGGYSYERVR